MSLAPIRRERGGGASRSLDISAVRAAVGARGQIPSALGLVTGPGTVNEDGDVEVEVTLHDQDVPITALLGGMWGSLSRGLYVGIAPNQEVLIGFPNGEYEATPVILMVLPSAGGDAGNLPQEMLDGDTWRNDRVVLGSDGDVLVVTDGGAVEVRSRNGTAVALATKADVQSLVDTYNGHTHIETGATTETPLPEASSPEGTTILKGE